LKLSSSVITLIILDLNSHLGGLMCVTSD
jgi:hypothetical protein